MFMDEDELRSLTGKMRHSSQAQTLNLLGIEHKIRPDGSIIVLKAHVEQLLGVKVEKKEKKHEPNWGAMSA